VRNERPAKFTGELAKPISLRLEELHEPLAALPERMKKLDLLKKHYGATDWAMLAYELAVDLVPGFQIVYDDPLAAELNRTAGLDLPLSGGVKAGRKGTGQCPELSGNRLILMVDMTRRLFKLKSNAAACKMIVDTWIEVKGPKISRKEHDSLVATIKRRLTEAKAHQSGV